MTPRPRGVVDLIRRIALLALFGAAIAWGYRALHDAGFRFRWEEVTGGDRAASGSRPATAADGRSPAAPAGRPAEPPARGALPGAPSDAVPGAEARPAGAGEPARIDFETLPDGRETCAPCAVSDEWESEGLVLSFRSWTASSTLPFVLDGREYLPPDRGRVALGPALQDERGLEVGVLRLDFSGRPRTVSFWLFGPDLVGRFAVAAWRDGDELPGAIERAPGGTYDAAGRGAFRAERITVRAPEGIDRISLDGWGPPGHILLVDDVVITP